MSEEIKQTEEIATKEQETKSSSTETTAKPVEEVVVKQEEVEVIADIPVVDEAKKDELFKPIASIASKQRKTLRKKSQVIDPLELKSTTIGKFQRNKKDFGSTEVQIALITQRILHITEHLKIHTKDKHTNYGLIKLVSKRKKLMNYLNITNPTKLKEIKTTLNLR